MSEGLGEVFESAVGGGEEARLGDFISELKLASSLFKNKVSLPVAHR